jgi:hypothetical protein
MGAFRVQVYNFLSFFEIEFAVVHFLGGGGGCCSKKRLPRSEAAMVVASDLGPICLQLDNHRLTFDDCEWTPGGDHSNFHRVKKN